jgi:hypothetical protein
MSEPDAKPVETGSVDREGPDRRQRVSLLNNWISIVGFFFVGVAILLLLTFGLFTLVSPSANPYVDIIAFLILPGILVLGLIIVPLGIVLKHWRLRRLAATHVGILRLPQLDLNNRRTRGAVLLFLLISIFVVLPALAVSSYNGYHYTESTAFCGRLCHTVMEPQATAYATSPHARVRCAECHIGEGASWFVKSKLSGTRQVLAVWRNSYPRPIPPAITELRPARETCEQCHWPAKFYGRQLKQIAHYSPDEQNTRRVVKALLKTGGADESIGRVEGIHMHMVLTARVEYVALDPGLQEIPWVKYVTSTGEETIYRSDGKSASDPRPEGVVRQVDCMDCHNRGAHHFRSPQQAVDLFLDVDRIDAALPFVKREAIAALTQPYPDVAAAEDGIERTITGFYGDNYPDIWKTRQASVKQAAEAIRTIYRRNFFPEMKVNWKTYPENVGHLESPGCLRCHDGEHINQRGERISSKCDVCHTFLNPVEGQSNALVEGEFQHSMDLVQHENLRCNQCHTGAKLPLCRDCHASGEWLDERGKEAFRPEGN